jgi:ABC-type sulfate transport system permease component
LTSLIIFLVGLFLFLPVEFLLENSLWLPTYRCWKTQTHQHSSADSAGNSVVLADVSASLTLLKMSAAAFCFFHPGSHQNMKFAATKPCLLNKTSDQKLEG